LDVALSRERQRGATIRERTTARMSAAHETAGPRAQSGAPDHQARGFAAPTAARKI